MYKKVMNKTILLGLLVFVSYNILSADGNEKETTKVSNNRSLSIEVFITLATNNDTEFEEILIDELSLQYSKDLQLPARDLVLSVKGQYDFFLGQERNEPGATMSLSKLFPYVGTSVSAEYKSIPSFSSEDNSSEFTFSLAQPIAENAFGLATRLHDKIVGLEIDVARHQIIEAYEDYFAAIVNAYYSWYEAYETLRIGESVYSENMKLLKNIKDRQKSKIALSIDVNKINIQVLSKKEKLVILRQEYDQALNIVMKAIRYNEDKELEPKDPLIYKEVNIDFKKEYMSFKQNSRTYEILDLLETKSSLEVDKDANSLLPSINLLVEYEIQGDDFGIEESDDKIVAGVSMDWPFPDQVDKAQYETSKIARDKTKLATKNTHFKLYTDLKNLCRQIEKEKEIIAIVDEKIQLALAVVDAETENYSFGKVTLNDFIQAVNVLDDNRFNKTSHYIQLKKLIVEWLRLTDKLIDKSDIK